MALKNSTAYNSSQEQFHDSLTGPTEGRGSRPAYLVEHLATFTVTRETGIVYPADGMRRLLQLEKTNGIWSQKMQLCLDGSWVLIMDYESGSIMERFSCSSIQEPTAFTSNDPMEMYNNILAFVVSGRGGARSEMHIFQCHDVGAQDLVEDLNHIRGGNKGPDRRVSQSGRYEDSDNHNGRDFVMERERDKEREIGERARRNQIPHFQNYGRETELEIAPRGHNEDDASSTSSDKLYEQDIAILNRCFDDIEKFIARLQHAAAASRELERRRRSRKSKKQTDPGEGMLSLRTRPPPEPEFYDIFQKFKLSFNLLAKLKSHIHDPNAPELVHFLFTPLALIVDASHDGCAEPRLATHVVQPLLTRETINLLVNCVTSKETELWHSLGDAWLIPRDQWKTPVQPYQPVFMDGWAPDFPVIDETPQQRSNQRRSDASSSTFHQHHHSLDDSRDDPYGEQYTTSARSSHLTEIPLRSAPHGIDSGSAGSSSPTRDLPLPPLDARRGGTPDADDLGQAWAEDVVARGGKIVRVTYPRTANNDKELTVVRGEYLEILDDSRKWWKARNQQGMTAHVPHTIVAPHAPQDVFSNPLYSTHYPPQDARGGSASPREAPGSSNNSEKVTPPPPPPPPPIEDDEPKSLPSSKYNTLSSKSIKSLATEDMQDELKMVLLLRDKRHSLDFLKTPDLYINNASSASEVQAWLEAKGFHEDVRKKLRGVAGTDLFRLPRSTLEEHAGDKEGRRLYSQLLVQKNVSGYKTTSTKELAAKLQKMKEKADV
ncbi:epidermal growth factor receptor kinase substrate 8-like isoform X2 [Arctopsyche grandis]|uniref:epidermal growth factor receptor kinase substrate 8-like isoform X2 n=1 Tax=Arctopsyche grandis TaxID=121162 RepID=UPI00406D64D8